MKTSRRIFIGAGAAAAAVAAGPLGLTKRAKAQSQGEINLYSSRHYNTDDVLYERFTNKTGIKVNLIEGKGNELLERIKAEGANSPADVFITVDAGNLWQAGEDNIFTPVQSDILESKIPANLRDPGGLWFGFSKRARVIMYNKDRVSPSDLSTYEDLASSKWRGRIAIRSSSNIYNQSLMVSILEANGAKATLDWARGFVSNFARPPQGNDRAQIEAAASGLADIAIANTYYLPRYAQANDPKKHAIFDQIGVFFPNQDDRGAHVNISGAGVVKNAPNKAGAIKFLEYMTSNVAQVFFAQGNNEYPVVKGTALDPVVASFGSFEEDTINVSEYGARSKSAIQIMDAVGWK